MPPTTTCLGFPRIGVNRELKTALESHWSGKISIDEVEAVARELRRRHWLLMQAAGIDHIPSNDFSLYDHMLDMAVTVGAIPSRYLALASPQARYFAMARGFQDAAAGVDLPALEMTKWFDTNYHYIVPELEAGQVFSLDCSRILRQIGEARMAGVETRPVIVGPMTFLLLSKMTPRSPAEATPLDSLEPLLVVYAELLSRLADNEVAWAQIDEPCLVLDLDDRARAAYDRALPYLGALSKRPRIMLATYFGPLADNLSLVSRCGLESLHIDLVRAPGQLEDVMQALPGSMSLSLGLVDGRNIWRTDLDAAHTLVRRAVARLDVDRIMLSPSCSLLHVPVDVTSESGLDAELKSWLSFATQKLAEIRALAGAAQSDSPSGDCFDRARASLASRRSSPRTGNPAVRQRTEAVDDGMLRRASPYPVRAQKQRARFQLPLLPTTTIGSFPQTDEVRDARAARRAGRMCHEEYDTFIRSQIRHCVQVQEAIGLDVLVHGEFERNDMVEYFGEQLDGFAFTENGWVQSYGSRCVKPPVIFGDVSRPRPMTVAWSTCAQALTTRPVKGMLTGPVTILQWSFVRNDQPREETCRQIALALREEVLDLESAGMAMIQVDEPALREGLPLRRGEWRAYLRWSVDAFRLATSGLRDETQLHTHMCYAQFGDILEAVVEMDADVISMEASRSKMELLSDFSRFQYPNEIGPGVYDIHSSRIPTSKEMVGLLDQATRVVPATALWVNPDCGLKTRRWNEVEQALSNMVEAAREMRRRVSSADKR